MAPRLAWFTLLLASLLLSALRARANAATVNHDNRRQLSRQSSPYKQSSSAFTCDYNYLDSNSTNSTVIVRAAFQLSANDTASLRAIAAKVAGIYSDNRGDAPVDGNPSLASRSVLLTTSNMRYRSLLEAWDCRTRSLGLKALVWVLDRDLHDWIHASSQNRSGLRDRVFFSASLLSAVPLLGGDGTDVRSAAVKVITCLKLFAVQTVMDLGYHVLLSDTDVYFYQVIRRHFTRDREDSGMLLKTHMCTVVWSSVTHAR